MPITDNMRLQIVMCYPNASIRTDDVLMKPSIYMVSSNRLSLYRFREGCRKHEKVVHVGRCTLVLRPISSLTDEECIEVANILVREGITPLAASRMCRVFLMDYEKKYVAEYSAHKIIKVIDYLRSINIITTVHGFDLVAEGIAIVDDKIGEI